MKAYHLDRPGSIDGLVLRETADPGLSGNQLLVRVAAVSVNNRDLMVVNDRYGFPIPAGLIPLSDAAGVVEAVGPEVRRFKVGDHVAPTLQIDWIGGPARPEYWGSDLGGSLPGVLATKLALPETAFVPIPAHLSLEEASTLSCAGITAWSSLTRPEPIGASDTVLVQGTGGVSIFALQFAKAMGARVIATTSSSEKAEFLKSLGADIVIDYVRNPEWDQAAIAATNGQGVDLVVETGGPTTIGRSIAALRIGGRMALVGFSGGMGPALDPLLLIGRGISIQTISVGSRTDFEDMNRLIEAHAIHPVIDKVFAFEEARDALEHLAVRRHRGKIVIRVTE